MKAKLTHNLPQIRCTEETRLIWDKMSLNNRRILSSMLQIVTEDVALYFKNTGNVFTFSEKIINQETK